MKFAQYLFDKKINQAKAAEKLGVSQQMISKLMLGHSRPGLELTAAIQDFSKGKVSLKDWL